MRAVQLPAGSLVCDSSEKFDRPKFRALRAAGFLGVLRYLGLGGPSPFTLDAQELSDAHAEGLVVGVLQYARTGGWSDRTGASDGRAFSDQARSLSIEGLFTPWLDFEAETFPGGPDIAIAYGTAWHGQTRSVAKDGRTGVYEGPGIPLTGEQWFHDLPQSHYYRSASAVPNVSRRGWSLLQLFPPDVVLSPGIIIDRDVVQSDYFGDLPWWIAP